MDAANRRAYWSDSGLRTKLSNGLVAWVLPLTCATWLILVPAVSAQVSLTGRGKNFVAPVTDAQGKKSILRGKDVRRAGEGMVEITGMQAETYRGQEKDLIVEAPQCRFNTVEHVASSAGPLSIRTADERFSIQGETFQWQMGDSRQTSRLVISNQVESLVRKRSVKLPGLGASSGSQATAGRVTNALPSMAGASTNDFIRITSQQFEYQGDRATFRGAVRVEDPEGTLTAETLAIVFQGASGALERIEAEQNVVLEQGSTRASADRAVYTLGENKELLEFIGHAQWEDGDRQGRGERLIFDRRSRVVRAEQKAYLKAPRAVLGQSGFLPGDSPLVPAGPDKQKPSFVEVFSELITIRLPQTNGPVQEIIAEKNVLIVDPEQDGRALADRAVYEESTGVLELTGAPMMETEGRLVSGQRLRFDRTTKTFTAGPDAYIKLPFQSVLEMGGLPAQPGQVAAAPTNQFVEVWAKSLEHQTNVLKFQDEVRANFLEGAVVHGKLTCRTLTITSGERVQSILADGQVELEQFARPDDPLPAVRRVSCERMRAHFNSAGRLEMALAEQGVRGEQEEMRPDQATPVLTKLQAVRATAHFSGWTNQLDRIVAEEEVVFTQGARVARGARAVYTESEGKLELTGRPTATLPEGRIDQAERLIWDRALNRFFGKGKFKSEWKRPPSSATNRLSQATAPAK